MTLTDTGTGGEEPLASARLKKEEDAVIWAACRLIASDINVYPNMSRADAVNEAYWLLDSAVHRYWAAQPAAPTESQATSGSGS